MSGEASLFEPTIGLWVCTQAGVPATACGCGQLPGPRGSRLHVLLSAARVMEMPVSTRLICMPNQQWVCGCGYIWQKACLFRLQLLPVVAPVLILVESPPVGPVGIACASWYAVNCAVSVKAMQTASQHPAVGLCANTQCVLTFYFPLLKECGQARNTCTQTT